MSDMAKNVHKTFGVGGEPSLILECCRLWSALGVGDIAVYAEGPTEHSAYLFESYLYEYGWRTILSAKRVPEHLLFRD